MSIHAPNTLFVVLAEPPAAREDEFHRWYDEVHGPDAIANGSFTGLTRYRAIGPGQSPARFLALWEGNYETEVDAWAYIRPRAHGLRAAGRVDDISSVRFALMMFGVRLASETSWPVRPSVVTTVQNDWRHADPSESVASWLARIGLDGGRPSVCAFTSDPAGRGGGFHLALHFHDGERDDAGRFQTSCGVAGASPTPPYKTIFADKGASAPADIDGREPADAWIMRWEPIARFP